jgi:hypothetical protein
MLDVHPPDHAAHTLRAFLIHIATIVIGLLIAIGLEQTVEYIHHRSEVRDARESLLLERRANAIRFAAETQELLREIPSFKQNVAVFAYLRDHPGAPPDKWPGQLGGVILKIQYADAVWRTAQQSNVLQFMPAAEVEQTGDLYNELQLLNNLEDEKFDSLVKLRGTLTAQHDPRLLRPEQLDRAIENATAVLIVCAKQSNRQRDTGRAFADFNPAPQLNYSDVLDWNANPAGFNQMEKLADQLHAQLRAIGAVSSDAAPAANSSLPAK